MTYADLKAAVNDWLARSDLSNANADFFIDLAEARINRSLRIKAMEAVYNELLDAAGTTPVSSDVLEFKHLFLADVDDDGELTLDDDLTIDTSALLVQSLADTNAVYRLEMRTVDTMADQFDANRAGGVPKYFARYGDRLYYWPLSTDYTYTAFGVYYARFPALSDSQTTNWLTDNAPDLLLAAVLAEAASYTKSPEQIQYWQARMDRAMNELQGADDRQEFSATPLTVRTRIAVP